MLVGRALAAGAAGVLLVLCATERATHAPAHIAALERQQELKVVMSECVDCLSACPGYVQNRSSFDNTSSFNEFSRLAQKECGMCYEGVKGPCPANADNHGVLRVAHRHATSLHTAGPNPVAGTYSQSPYTKQTYPRSMGTNQVFLGQVGARAGSSAADAVV